MTEQTNVTAARLWIVLAKAYGSMAGWVEESIAAEGLGLSDFMVMEALLHKGPLTMTEISRKLLLANASMTSAIDRLERKSLVARTFDGEDRRIRRVALTARGRKLIEATYKRHEQGLNDLMKDLSETERKAVYRGLKKIGFAAKAATGGKEQQ